MSEGVSITFTADILAHAASRGIKLSPAEVGEIDKNLNTITTVQDGVVTLRLGRDRVVDVGEAVEAMSAGYGRVVDAPAPAASIPEYATATERAVAMNAAIRAGSDAAKQSQAEALVRTFGNPWRTGNATHRAYLQNTHPTLASRLRHEAGDRK